MPEVKEQTETAPEAAAPRKSLIPANLMPLLTKIGIFGVIGMVAIVAAFLITTKVLKPMMARSTTPTTEQAAKPAPVEEKKQEAKAEETTKGEEGGKGEAAASEGNYYSIENIVVNPAGTGGTDICLAE